jgi:hypothetical protein
LSTEHRAASSQDHIPLALSQSGSALTLSVMSGASSTPLALELAASSAIQRVQQALAQLGEPASVKHLQNLCGMRTATVCSALAELSGRGPVSRAGRGYQLSILWIRKAFPFPALQTPREMKRETPRSTARVFRMTNGGLQTILKRSAR